MREPFPESSRPGSTSTSTWVTWDIVTDHPITIVTGARVVTGTSGDAGRVSGLFPWGVPRRGPLPGVSNTKGRLRPALCIRANERFDSVRQTLISLFYIQLRPSSGLLLFF